MLYYVKTDRLFKNLDVETDDFKFFFDVSALEHKKANEKREIIYEFKEKRDNGTIAFNVYYSEGGRKTKIVEILRALKNEGVNITEDILEKAFRIFEKQSEIDYFINKNAREFLREQFNIWLYQYVFSGESEWTEKRIKQLQALKDIALKVIDFISQFEDELVKIWNKPKFVLNSNYVIALRTLKDYTSNKEYDEILLEALKNLENNKDFLDEIVEVIKEIYKKPLANIYVSGVVIKKNPITQQLVFNLKYVKRFDNEEKYKEYIKKQKLKKGYKETCEKNGKKITYFYADYDTPKLIHEVDVEKIYIDTKFFDEKFKLRLLKLISKKISIDDALDGYLIKGDNYHALRTIAPKFENKIKLVYIDPPFNTEGSGFIYVDKFFDSSWISMIENRITLSLPLLREEGGFYIHLDHHCNYYARLLLDSIFGKEPQREIIWNTSKSISGYKSKPENWIRQHDTILYYSKSDNPFFNKLWVSNENRRIKELGWLDLFKDKNDNLFVKKYVGEKRTLERVNIEKIDIMAIGDVWNDILSLMYTQNMVRENWGQDNTQKPENLLRRIIQSSTQQREWILDFFCGSGTTIAAAHKLNRRWIGIEMGSFFEDIDLKRMKVVVFGDIRPKLSEDLNWQGGGFFKYYEVEQYEDALRKAKYEDSDLFDNPYEDPYNQYIFLRDLKMLEALEIDYENNKVNVDFSNLYKNIDLPETLSNLFGKWIKKITIDYVEFEDGEKINLKSLDYKKIKPLIWW